MDTENNFVEKIDDSIVKAVGEIVVTNPDALEFMRREHPDKIVVSEPDDYARALREIFKKNRSAGKAKIGKKITTLTPVEKK